MFPLAVLHRFRVCFTMCHIVDPIASEEMSVTPPIRDFLYQEGVILADFVVNEFLNSESVSRILGQDKHLRAKLGNRLRDQLSTYRQECLVALEQCEFIDVTPQTDADVLMSALSVRTSTPAPPINATPTEISRATLSMLKSKPLAKQTLLSPIKGNRVKEQPIVIDDTPTVKEDVESQPEVVEISSSSDNIGRAGRFSGMKAPLDLDLFSSDDDDSEKLCQVPTSRPPTPSELRLRTDHIWQSSYPIELHGVMHAAASMGVSVPQSYETPPGTRKRRRKRGGGFLTKDGTFHDVLYGGFVHLCGGALEWPFRTAEVVFRDFFRTESKTPQVEDSITPIQIQK